MTSKARGTLREKNNKEGILEQELYVSQDTEEYFKNHHLRLRKQNKEGPPLR